MNEEESDDEENARLAASMDLISEYFFWLIFLIKCFTRPCTFNQSRNILSLEQKKIIYLVHFLFGCKASCSSFLVCLIPLLVLVVL